MKTGWENDGEPNAEGKYTAYIDMEDGSGVQRFIGSNHKEVSDQLLVAQGHATNKIREFTRSQPVAPAKSAIEFKPRTLTADDRFELSHAMTDPEKGPEAVRTIIEAELGAPLKDVRERLSAEEVSRQANVAREEAETFAAETPDYFVCDFNARSLARYMQTQGYAPVKANFAKAFEEMKAAGLVVFRPSGETEEEVENPHPTPPNRGGLPEKPEVATRPRGVVRSTGLRAGDSSASADRRPAKPKYTRAEIEAMPQAQYKNLLSTDKEFAAAVDALFA